ncbi:somatomedin-B and thrombospondin type-1 domain-containing protein-like [Limulus polyphemus]|uniref:Somatomedin-B and thrombospondin type-1 domain-containing protein-like n=1 Tax=Limulus polyphemus TaxID=6850 RepID=A0ABM1BK79_LIMPO|nr:somatomedin-B and thrombospondin type-1 domain-containing protein-like [Limulus polyphemus]
MSIEKQVPKLAFMVLLVIVPKIRARGSCLEAKLCCPGRDSSCVVQKAPLNSIIEDLTDRPCYCDHACLKVGDCCYDFKEACRVVNCEVSDWGPWSKCDADCGPGMMTRQRFVLKSPQNGGEQCPELSQKRGCAGTKCEDANRSQKALKETALILRGEFSKMRTMNATHDIRKNLRLRYPKDPAKERSQEYCVVFEITKSHHKCSSLAEDAAKLKKGDRVCVACEEAAMRKHLGYRCTGHGVDGKATRWAALDTSNCHGRWVRMSEHSVCPCHSDPTPDFIFV